MKFKIITGAIALAVSATSAAANALILVNTDKGEVVAAANNGMTLYTFRKDNRNKSNCYGDCAAAWPPFIASASASPKGALTIIQRNDGSHQWALNGKPLYFWAGDQRRGDANGDGVGGVWDVVRQSNKYR